MIEDKEHFVIVHHRISDHKVVLGYPQEGYTDGDGFEGHRACDNYKVVMMEGHENEVFDGTNAHHFVDTDGEIFQVYIKPPAQAKDNRQCGISELVSEPATATSGDGITASVTSNESPVNEPTVDGVTENVTDDGVFAAAPKDSNQMKKRPQESEQSAAAVDEDPKKARLSRDEQQGGRLKNPQT